jgi:hypothetical protein
MLSIKKFIKNAQFLAYLKSGANVEKRVLRKRFNLIMNKNWKKNCQFTSFLTMLLTFLSKIFSNLLF